MARCRALPPEGSGDAHRIRGADFTFVALVPIPIDRTRASAPRRTARRIKVGGAADDTETVRSRSHHRGLHRGFSSGVRMTLQPRKPTIAIVDDEVAIRSAMTRFFERRGWRCLQASDGEEALVLLFGDAAAEIDVVLCDVRLPGMSGLELFDRATRERPAVAERFVLASGDTEGMEVACPVLAKPYPLAELAKVADSIAGRSAA